MACSVWDDDDRLTFSTFSYYTWTWCNIHHGFHDTASYYYNTYTVASIYSKVDRRGQLAGRNAVMRICRAVDPIADAAKITYLHSGLFHQYTIYREWTGKQLDLLCSDPSIKACVCVKAQNHTWLTMTEGQSWQLHLTVWVDFQVQYMPQSAVRCLVICNQCGAACVRASTLSQKNLSSTVRPCGCTSSANSLQATNAMILDKVSFCRQGNALWNFLGEYCIRCFKGIKLYVSWRKHKTCRFFSGETARKTWSRSRVTLFNARVVRDVGKPGCTAASKMERLKVICFKVPVHSVSDICRCRCIIFMSL